MPFVPSGIAVKLSFPIAFCEVLNVQWALPETCRSPLRGGGNKSIINRFAVRQQQGCKGHGSPLGTGSPWLTSVLLCTPVSTAPESEDFHLTWPLRQLCHLGARGQESSATPRYQPGARTASCTQEESTAQLPGKTPWGIELSLCQAKRCPSIRDSNICTNTK